MKITGSNYILKNTQKGLIIESNDSSGVSELFAGVVFKSDDIKESIKMNSRNLMCNEIYKYLQTHSMRDLSVLCGVSVGTIHRLTKNKHVKNKTILNIYKSISLIKL